jgi:hypothetical protein
VEVNLNSPHLFPVIDWVTGVLQDYDMASVGTIPPVHEILWVEHLLDLGHGNRPILPLICQPGIHVGIGSANEDQIQGDIREMQRLENWGLVPVFMGWQV